MAKKVFHGIFIIMIAITGLGLISHDWGTPFETMSPMDHIVFFWGVALIIFSFLEEIIG